MPTVVTPRSRSLLSVESTARRLGISRSTLYRLIREHEIESVLVRGSRRVSTSAIDRYIRRLEDEQRIGADDEVPPRGAVASRRRSQPTADRR